MAKSRAEIQKAYRERKKSDPNYMESDRKRAAEKRKRFKENATPEMLEVHKREAYERVKKFRASRRNAEQISTFKSVQSKGKALKKVQRALPRNLMRRREIVSALLGSESHLPPSQTIINQVPPPVAESAKKFYYSDEISFISSETKHRRSKRNSDVQVRIMTLTLREAYAAFCQGHPNFRMSLTTFYHLKPPEVKYMSAISHNVCLCSVHENFRFKVDALYHVDTTIFISCSSLQNLEVFLLCDTPNDDCFLSKCTNCERGSKLRHLVAQLDEEKLAQTLSWYVWKTAEKKEFKQVVKETMEGTIMDLVDLILASCEKFFKHIYIQRAAIDKFEKTKEEATKPDSSTLAFQIDFAENYRCFHQGSTQGGHYGYNLVIFLFIQEILLVSVMGTFVVTFFL